MYIVLKGMKSMTQRIEDLSIATIRTLSIDAIEKANSGHPGANGSCSNGIYIVDKIYEHQSKESKLVQP